MHHAPKSFHETVVRLAPAFNCIHGQQTVDQLHLNMHQNNEKSIASTLLAGGRSDVNQSLSLGKIRGLSQLSSEKGIFSILACDQRGNMIRMMQSAGVANPTYADIVRAKLDIVGPLSRFATGALLDAEYGAGTTVASLALRGRCGLVVAVEETGYQEREGDRLSKVLDGWSVEKIKRMGASAVKLLLYYNPNRKAAAEQQEQLVEEIAAECKRVDIPFMLEGIVYPTEDGGDKAAFIREREDLVVESARALSRFDIDLYKVEFPIDPTADVSRQEWERACKRLNDACRTPWALLSAGVSFEKYCDQLTVACEAGASGFVAGRAIWREAIELTGEKERQTFMATEMPRRMQLLIDIADQHARPWFEVPSHEYDANALVPEFWYEKYPSF